MLQMSPVGVYSVPEALHPSSLSLYVSTTSNGLLTPCPVIHHVPSLPQRSSAKEVFLCACALVNLSNVEFYSHFSAAYIDIVFSKFPDELKTVY